MSVDAAKVRIGPVGSASGLAAADGTLGRRRAAAASGPDATDGTAGRRRAAGSETAAASGQDPLSPDQKRVVEQLKARDREVRAHEQAHAAVGGRYAGQPTYEYQRGPDGKRYAVGGRVQIDASEVPGDPEATVEKMRIVRAAALAPAEPSSQDRKVAQQAAQTLAEAQLELRQEKTSDSEGDAGSDMPTTPTRIEPADPSRGRAAQARAAYGRWTASPAEPGLSVYA